MKWIKKGLIFCPEGSNENMKSHAAIPFADVLDKNILRVYFSSRNSKGYSIPYFLELNRNQPQTIIKISQPLIPLGELGTFDECGIMPSCIVENDGLKYMYYIAWNPQVSVTYRLSIGLAISEDGGISFNKYSNGPICDRSIHEPYFNTAPYVIKDKNIWKMWYISTTKWEMINGLPEPYYHVKYASSNDGISWKKEGVVCIDYDEKSQAVGRPCVFRENGIYKMYYSYRMVEGYRKDRDRSYRIGYAESFNGIDWKRKDNHAGIDVSMTKTEWDYEMIEYCHVTTIGDQQLMFYNGNGFGKTGFGYAVRKSRI